MPVPSPRSKLLPARGNAADLLTNVSSLVEGEICYAVDENAYYQKVSGSLVKVSGGSGSGESYDDTVLAGRVTTVEGDVDALETTVAGLSSYDDTALDARVTTAEGEIDALETTVSGLSNYDDSAIDGRVGQLETDVSGLANYDDTALAGRVTTAEGEIDALETTVAGLSSYDDTALAGRVTTAESDIDALETTVSGLSSYDDTALTTRVTTAESDIGAVDARVETLELGGGGASRIQDLTDYDLGLAPYAGGRWIFDRDNSFNPTPAAGLYSPAVNPGYISVNFIDADGIDHTAAMTAFDGLTTARSIWTRRDPKDPWTLGTVNNSRIEGGIALLMNDETNVADPAPYNTRDRYIAFEDPTTAIGPQRPLSEGDVLKWSDADQSFNTAPLSLAGLSDIQPTLIPPAMGPGIYEYEFKKSNETYPSSGQIGIYAFSGGGVPNFINYQDTLVVGKDFTNQIPTEIDPTGDNKPFWLSIEGAPYTGPYTVKPGSWYGDDLPGDPAELEINEAWPDSIRDGSLEDASLIRLSTIGPGTPAPISTGDVMRWSAAAQKFNPAKTFRIVSVALTGSEAFNAPGIFTGGEVGDVWIDAYNWVLYIYTGPYDNDQGAGGWLSVQMQEAGTGGPAA